MGDIVNDYEIAHTTSSLQEMTRLIADPLVNPFCLSLLAENRHTPADLLEQLSTFAVKDIKLSVLLNPNTPTHVVDHFVFSKDFALKHAAYSNPNVSFVLLANAELPAQLLDLSYLFKDSQLEAYTQLKVSFKGTVKELLLLINTL